MLTPRNFYWEALHQLGCTPRFYRGDAKRQLHKALVEITESERKNPVVIVDEAHLLSREMLEEIRFLLNWHNGKIPGETNRQPGIAENWKLV